MYVPCMCGQSALRKLKRLHRLLRFPESPSRFNNGAPEERAVDVTRTRLR